MKTILFKCSVCIHSAQHPAKAWSVCASKTKARTSSKIQLRCLSINPIVCWNMMNFVSYIHWYYNDYSHRIPIRSPGSKHISIRASHAVCHRGTKASAHIHNFPRPPGHRLQLDILDTFDRWMLRWLRLEATSEEIDHFRRHFQIWIRNLARRPETSETSETWTFICAFLQGRL